MKTTLTIVDNIRGTTVLETDGIVELNHYGDSFSIKIDGAEQGPTTTGPSEPAVIIRTPEPAAQSMTVTEVPEDGSTPKGLVQQAADKMAKDESDRKDREILNAATEHAFDHASRLEFIQEFTTRIQTKCQTCGQVVYIEKQRYSGAQLREVKKQLINYPTPETSQSAPVAPEQQKTEEAPAKPAALVLNGPAPRKQATKKCVVCGDEFQGGNRAMYCERHRDPATRSAAQPATKAKVQAADDNGHPTANSPLPEGMWWCIHHQSQQPHRSPDCPLLNDAPKKSPAQIAAEATEAAGLGAEFTDPWNCARCRDETHLCKFHRSMEASGSKPPTNAHQL